MIPPSILVKLSQFPSPYPGEAKKGDTDWITGLRGIAACCVISHHVFFTLRDDVVLPASEHIRLYGFFHWPFIHAFTEGYQWVCMFLILSAWVGALKPLRALNRRDSISALSIMCKSAMKRPLRLMIPAAIVTIISCVMAQFNLFSYGAQANTWMVHSSPAPQGSIWVMFQELLRGLWASWFYGDNYYERNQWAMKYFLGVSWKLYAVLLPLGMMDNSWRRIVLGIQFGWAWSTHDCVQALTNIPTYSGIAFAELSLVPLFQDYAFSNGVLPRILSPILLIFGWYLISFPGYNWEWAPWFHWIWSNHEFWYGSGDVYRLTCSIGVWCILISILISPKLQSILNSQLIQWLGKHSFAMYLVHGPVLRSLLTFCAYGLFVKEEHPKVVGFRLVFSLGMFIGVTLYLSTLWVEYVEPWCERLTNTIEKKLNSHFDMGSVAQDLFVVQKPEKFPQNLDLEKY